VSPSDATVTTELPDQPEVTVLGTGRMGSAIARRLAASGLKPRVWNRTRERAENLQLGIPFDTPARAVQAADLVLSALADSRAVRDVYYGADGALQGASGQLFVEMSTAGPDMIADLDQAIEGRNSRLIEAPIFGNQHAVAAGIALLLVGGDKADVERATKVLATLGPVHHVGELGTGARLKLIANSLFAVTNVVVAELMAAGVLLGINRETIFWVLTQQAPYLASRHAGFVEDQYDDPLFSLREMLKDLHLATDAYSRVGASTPVTSLVRGLIEEAVPAVGELDLAAILTRFTGRPSE